MDPSGSTAPSAIHDMPLHPVSPSRENVMHPLSIPILGSETPKTNTKDPQSFIYASEVDTGGPDAPLGSTHSSPTRHRNQHSDVQGMVARFNALEIKDHAELRRRDEAALKRAQMGREQAEEEVRRTREECRSLRKDLEEARERERRVVRRLDTVMEQFHSEKEKVAGMQKTYEREIRRARKEAFKSSSALLETQKEFKVTKAALHAAKVNLEKWVLPDGEELKVRAEGLAYELASAQRLVEFLKMECHFGACACKLAETRGEAYVVDHDEDVKEMMRRLRPGMGDMNVDEEQPPAYEDELVTDTHTVPLAARATRCEKHERRSATLSPRRSSTVQPPGDAMVFSPNSGTFRRVPLQPADCQPDLSIHQGEEYATQTHACDSPYNVSGTGAPDTPTTPSTSIPPTSPDRDIPTASEDEHDYDRPRLSRHENQGTRALQKSHHQETASLGSPPLELSSVGEDEATTTPNGAPPRDSTTCTHDDQVEGGEEDEEDDDDETPDSPTTHIRATTQTTMIPLAGMSSPAKHHEDELQGQTLYSDDERPTPHAQDPGMCFDRTTRSNTPANETFISAAEENAQAPASKSLPVTPRMDTNVDAGTTVPPDVKAAGNENILSATPWEAHASTPLTRDEAIAMLRARRGRAVTNTSERAPGTDVRSTIKRSASHGQALTSDKKGAMGSEARRDISTVSEPDLGARSRSRGSPRKGR